jgi:hypothetical protein
MENKRSPKIGILLNILINNNDINMSKFAINYLGCLTSDETALSLLKDYLNSILELVFKFLLEENQQIIVILPLILV